MLITVDSHTIQFLSHMDLIKQYEMNCPMRIRDLYNARSWKQ